MNLNGKVTNPGEMRTAITILQRDIIMESGGFQVPDLIVLDVVWSKWTNAHGSEAWIASSVQAESPATVLIRYIEGIDASCVIQKGSDLFEIVSLDNIQERGEYIELKVKRWQPG